MSIMKTIDLFAGAGGMTEGFRQAGFHCLFANDFDDSASATFRRNHSETLVSAESIETLQPQELMDHLSITKGSLDVLIGGPPCQGFSTYGKRDPKDLRNQLYKQYLRFLDALEPKTFVIENVVGILSMLDGQIIEDILQHAKKLGYTERHGIVNAADYGVPQIRKRVIIIGTKGKQAINHPAPTHHEPTNGRMNCSRI
jgi:DNA (cytosine-5)-methyltransferase 1